MTVLILDDQPHVIAGLMLGVHWEKCGITRILKATSAQEARRRMESTQVDILLCDIEMPSESGLDFISWLRKNGYATECIVLTAHANFDYAQRALQLGSIDYILQPAPYEKVEAVLLETVRRVMQRREEKRYSSYGHLLWGKHEQLYRMILSDWLEGRYTDAAELRKDLSQLDFSLAEDAAFLCAYCRFDESNDNNQILLDSTLSECVDAAACRLLTDTQDQQGFALVVCLPQGTAQAGEIGANLSALPQRVLSSCGLNLRMACAPAPCGMMDVPDTLEELQELLPDKDDPQPAAQPPRTAAEHNALTPLALCQQLKRRLGSEQFSPGSEAFQQLYYDFLQHLSASLQSHGLSLREVMGERLLQLMNAHQSVEQLAACVDWAIAQLSRETAAEKSTQEQLNAIVEYIYQNMEKDIRRSDVARAVYLSPGHLSRFFKERMNITLKEFIIQEKMKLAHTLLVSTKLPISVIASKIGYTNFSYFSQTYKRVWGVSPSKEREGTEGVN